MKLRLAILATLAMVLILAGGLCLLAANLLSSYLMLICAIIAWGGSYTIIRLYAHLYYRGS